MDKKKCLHVTNHFDPHKIYPFWPIWRHMHLPPLDMIVNMLFYIFMWWHNNMWNKCIDSGHVRLELACIRGNCGDFVSNLEKVTNGCNTCISLSVERSYCNVWTCLNTYFEKSLVRRMSQLSTATIDMSKSIGFAATFLGN